MCTGNIKYMHMYKKQVLRRKHFSSGQKHIMLQNAVTL